MVGYGWIGSDSLEYHTISYIQKYSNLEEVEIFREVGYLLRRDIAGEMNASVVG